MATLNQLRRIREYHEDALLSLPNVVGVGIGYRTINGRRTDELAIIVDVKKKVPENALRPTEVVPRIIRMSVEGTEVEVPTDVEETGEFYAQEFVPLVAPYDQRKRPVQPGYSIGWRDGNQGSSGTLGIFVVRNSDNQGFMLSNNHVFVRNNSTGVTVLQPGGSDNGQPSDRVGATYNFVRLDMHGDNYIDAAIASIDASTPVDPAYPTIGLLTGYHGSVDIDQRLVKVGRTTGRTEGIVKKTDYASTVNYPFGPVKFKNQVQLCPGSNPVGLRGDSGSVWVDQYGYAQLLHFAGNESGDLGIASPINWVMDAFDISVWNAYSPNAVTAARGGKEVAISKSRIVQHRTYRTTGILAALAPISNLGTLAVGFAGGVLAGWLISRSLRD